MTMTQHTRPVAYLTRRYPDAVEAAFAEHFDVSVNLGDVPRSSADLLRALAECDVLVPTVSDILDDQMFGHVPYRTSLIANVGVGVNHIDLPAAARAGIVVTNTPDVLTDDTADLTIALMLMATRRLGEGERLLRGGVLIVSNGRSIYSPGPALTYLGSAKLFGLPVAVLVFGLVALIVGLVFKYHRYGRALYAIGGNEDAARAAGINVDRVIWSAFVYAALLAGLAGVLMTGRLDSAVTTQGQGIIFSAFAAAVIGGVSLGGGRGTMVGLVSGVLLIGVINNLLTLAQVPSFYVQASTGAVIIIAAVLTTVASRRSSGVRTRT